LRERKKVLEKDRETTQDSVFTMNKVKKLENKLANEIKNDIVYLAYQKSVES
jgi:hypothetical protein